MANIEKRGENSYRFTVSVGQGPDGRYKYKRKTIKITEKMSPKQLEKHLTAEFLQFEKEAKAGLYIDPTGLTLRQLSEIWRDKYLEQELAETSQATHLSHLKVHILPDLGHIRMDKFNPLILTDFLSNLKRKDSKGSELSITTKQDVYKTLKSLFKFAKKQQVIPSDPMEGVSKPSERRKGKKKGHQIYERHQIRDLMEKLQSEPLQWQLFVNLAIWCGLRRSELLALEWKHFDLDTRTLSVERAIVNGRTQSINKETKSETSERVVGIPDNLIPLIEKYRKHWNKINMEFRDLRADLPREYIFCNEAGEFVKPDSASQWWRRFTKRRDIPFIRLHDLRHTYASLLIEMGTPVTDTAAALGHSSPKVTLSVYSHSFETATERTAAGINNVMSSLPLAEDGMTRG